jgi:tetratricopeptide (TPR) repeat protein
MNINTQNILRLNKNQLLFQFYKKISILGVMAMILTPNLVTATPPASQTLIEQVSTNSENQPPIFLELGKPIQQKMAGNQKHQYQINLQDGEYLHLTVNQNNIDLFVTLFTPQGDKLIVSDSLNGAYGIEPISAIAPTTGQYLIEIQSDPRAKKIGSYEIWLKAQQIPTAENQKRVQAERQFMAAVQTYLQATKEAKELSLQEFHAALLTYQAINDPMMIGAILSVIGSIYDDMGEKTEALNYYNQALPMRKTAGDKSGEANTLTSMGLVYNRLVVK